MALKSKIASRAHRATRKGADTQSQVGLSSEFCYLMVSMEEWGSIMRRRHTHTHTHCIASGLEGCFHPSRRQKGSSLNQRVEMFKNQSELGDG